MQNTMYRAILVALPVLTGVLVYGALSQQRVLWGVLSVAAVLAVLGLGIVITDGTPSARAQRATLPSILRVCALTSIVVTGSIALADAVTGHALRLNFYAGALTAALIVLLALATVRLTHKPR